MTDPVAQADASPELPPGPKRTPFDLFLGRLTPPRWGRWDALALGGYLLLILLWMLPMMTGGRLATERGGDIVGVWLWSREYLGDVLRSFSLPLFNPWSSAGVPYLASQQTAVFYPPNWLFALFPTVWVLNAQMVVHFWAGLATMHWLARHLGRSVAGAVAAALVFGFSGFAVLHWWQGHIPFLLEWPWTPLAVIAWSSIQRRSQRNGTRETPTLPVLALGGILAVQFFGGQPQITWFTLLLLCGLQAGWLLWSVLAAKTLTGTLPQGLERPSSAALRGAICLAAGAALAAPLTAVQAFPMLDFLKHSTRGGMLPLHELQVHSLPPSHSAMLVAPWAFGGTPELPYLAFGDSLLALHEVGCYVGAVTLVLALAALFAGGRRGAGLRWTLAAIFLFAWWMALGQYGGLHEVLVGVLPGLATFRSPGRFAFVFTFAIALLAAGGLDAVRYAAASTLPELRRAIRRAVVLSALLIGALALVFALLFSRGADSPFFREMMGPQLVLLPEQLVTPGLYEKYFAAYAGGLGAAALLGCAALAAVALLAVSRLRPAATAMLLTLLVAELARFAFTYRASTDPAALLWSPEVRRILTSGEGRFRYGSDRHLADLLQGMTAGARHVWGAEPLIVQRYQTAMQISQREYGRFKYVPQVIPQNYSTPFTRALGMRWLLNTRMVQADGPWRVVLQEGEALVLEDPGALPRGYTVSEARVVAPEEVVWAVNAQDFVASTTVLLEEAPPADMIEPHESGGGVSPGRVQITEDLPERFSANVRMARPGWFVLMDQYLPGWTARVNGRPAKIYRANAAGRALPLRPGDYRIEMTYKAPGLATGAWISAAGWVLWSVAVLMLLSNRRRGTAPARDDPSG